MNKKILIGIATAAMVILIATLAYAMTRPTANRATDIATDQPATEQKIQETQPTESADTSNAQVSTLTYENNGFSPSPLIIKKGTIITVKNNSISDLTFASADHPTHQDNPELNMDTINPKESATLTITKIGTWDYHNHNNADHFGQIIVTE